MLAVQFRSRWPALLWIPAALTSCAIRQPAPAGPRLLQVSVVERSHAYSALPNAGLSPAYDPISKQVRLTLSANEAAGFLVRLDHSGAADLQLTLAASSLADDRGPLPGAELEMFRVVPVKLEPPPGWHIKSVAEQDRYTTVPDVLVPLEATTTGRSVTARAGEPLLLWADFSIPASAPPGTYRSSIEVLERGVRIASIPVSVSVRPIVLPDDPGVALLAPLDLHRLLGHHLQISGEPFAPERVLRNAPLYESSRDLIHRTLVLLQHHRLSPFLTGFYPIAKLDERGELEVKWDDYDELIGPFLDGDLLAREGSVRYWSVPFDETCPTPPPYDPLSSPTYARTLRQYLTQCAAHFEERGWLDRAFLILPPLTPSYSAAAFKATRSYAEIARLSGRKIKLVSLLPPQDLRSYGWDGYPFQELSGYVDVWCPSAQFFDRSVFEQPQFLQTEQWLRLDRPPYSGSIVLAAPEEAVRVIPWQAARLRAKAILLPTVNEWSRDYAGQDPLEHLRTHADSLLVPGRAFGLETPLATLRLKQLRSGMQDLAYLKLCREQGLNQIHDMLIQSLCPRAGVDAAVAHLDDGRYDAWSSQPRAWKLAVELMATALESRTADAPDGMLPDSINWQEFQELTQAVRMKCLSARINLGPSQPAEPGDVYLVELSVAVENNSPGELTATIGFGELPPGWKPETAQLTLDRIPRYSAQTVKLRARTDAVTTDDDGKLMLPVILRPEQAEPQTVWMPLAHLTVRRVAQPIRVDGNLDDWPLGLGNVARTFSPVHAGGSSDRTTASLEKKSENVIAWVCSDQNYLYFAFHCLKPKPLRLARTQSSFVRYEDRVPFGEELMEVLLQPANDESTSPADLLHLVIKPSASLFKERGIRCYPPVGLAEDWPAQIDVATRLLEDRWIGEVRIPITALGPPGKGLRTCGVNFCHFDADAWTYSTWSGAQWNTYNPATLGNMTFPR